MGYAKSNKIIKVGVVIFLVIFINFFVESQNSQANPLNEYIKGEFSCLPKKYINAVQSQFSIIAVEFGKCGRIMTEEEKREIITRCLKTQLSIYKNMQMVYSFFKKNKYKLGINNIIDQLPKEYIEAALYEVEKDVVSFSRAGQMLDINFIRTLIKGSIEQQFIIYNNLKTQKP